MPTLIKIGGGYSVGYEDGHSDGYNSGHSVKRLVVNSYSLVTGSVESGYGTPLHDVAWCDTGNNNSKHFIAHFTGTIGNVGSYGVAVQTIYLYGSNDNSNWNLLQSDASPRTKAADGHSTITYNRMLCAFDTTYRYVMARWSSTDNENTGSITATLFMI